MRFSDRLLNVYDSVQAGRGHITARQMVEQSLLNITSLLFSSHHDPLYPNIFKHPEPKCGCFCTFKSFSHLLYAPLVSQQLKWASVGSSSRQDDVKLFLYPTTSCRFLQHCNSRCRMYNSHAHLKAMFVFFVLFFFLHFWPWPLRAEQGWMLCTHVSECSASSYPLPSRTHTHTHGQMFT